MATTQTVTDWRKEWFEIEDATYLNTAAHAAMPRVTLRAVQNSIEANKFPHHLDDAVFFEAPIRIRASLSKMIGARPEEIAVTAGAGAGVATVAHFLTWKPGDEVIFRLVAALRSKWLLRPPVQKVSARCEVPTANSINDTKDEREER